MDKQIKSSKLFNELGDEMGNTLFYYKEKNIIHNIDNIYYSVNLVLDHDGNDKVEGLINDLESKKMKQKDYNRPISFFKNLEITHKRFSMYEYNLSSRDEYDVFIASYLPNDSTPRIHVQIRAMYLWTNSTFTALFNSLNVVHELLNSYGLEIHSVVENRIDYAFHMNYHRNPDSYYGDKKLAKYLRYTGKYHEVGYISDGQKSKDYLGLGSRNANNVFYRLYNKTREVIEKGYKSFFIEYWFSSKMISYFDYYCYKYAYSVKNYDSLVVGRMLFYIEHGTDLKIKEYFYGLMDDLKNGNVTYAALPYKDIKKYIPEVNIIMNNEFETKRKFYATTQEFNSWMFGKHDILVILDNYEYVIEYLTRKFVAWGVKESHYDKVLKKTVTNIIYTDWWTRVRKTKKVEDLEKLKRSYTNGVDEERIKKQLISKVASMAVLKFDSDAGFRDDLIDFMSNLNDNDIYDYDDIKREKLKYYERKLPKPLD